MHLCLLHMNLKAVILVRALIYVKKFRLKKYEFTEILITRFTLVLQDVYVIIIEPKATTIK